MAWDLFNDAHNNAHPLKEAAPARIAPPDDLITPLRLRLRPPTPSSASAIAPRALPPPPQPPALPPPHNKPSTKLQLRVINPRATKYYASLKPRFDSSFIPPQRRNSRLRTIVMSKVIARLRNNGALPYPLDAPPKATMRKFLPPTPMLWDPVARKKLQDPTFHVPKSYDDLFSRCLVFHPHLEPYTGQDLLIRLATEQRVKLIPISDLAPSNKGRLWNKKRKCIEDYKTKNKEAVNVGNIITNHKNIEPYVGQGTIYRGATYRALRSTAAMYSRRGLGLSRTHWMLFDLPEVVCFLNHNGWSPNFVSVHRTRARDTVFWNKVRAKLHLTNPDSDLSIADFLDASRGRYEAYRGQDLTGVSEDKLKEWFNLIKWGPGCRNNDMIPVLDGINAAKKEIAGTKRTELPSAKNDASTPKRNKRRRETRDKRADKRRKKDTLREASVSDETLPGNTTPGSTPGPRSPLVMPEAVPVLAVQTKKRGSSSKSRRKAHGREDDYEITPAEKGRRSSKPKKRVRTPSPDLRAPMSAAEPNANLAEKPKKRKLPREIILLNEDWGHAKVAALREAKRIRRVVTGLMVDGCRNGDLADLRKSMHEELHKYGDFDELIHKLGNGVTAEPAAFLANELEQLDVAKFFTQEDPKKRDREDELYLDHMMEGLLFGEIFSTQEVMDRFRTCCVAHTRLNGEHTVASTAAFDIARKGENALRFHQNKYPDIMKLDDSVARIRRLVDRAQALVPDGNYAGTNNAADNDQVSS